MNSLSICRCHHSTQRIRSRFDHHGRPPPPASTSPDREVPPFARTASFTSCMPPPRWHKRTYADSRVDTLTPDDGGRHRTHQDDTPGLISLRDHPGSPVELDHPYALHP